MFDAVGDGLMVIPYYKLTGGCPMEAALSPSQVEQMRAFLQTLIVAANAGQRDVGRVMKAWKVEKSGFRQRTRREGAI